MRVILVFFFFYFHLYGLEKDYQNVFCVQNDGIIEYTLQDRRRVDCLTKDYAIEVDYAYKYREAITQALEYSMDTNLRAGILLIIKNKDKDQKYIKRLYKFLDFYGLDIKVWIIDGEYNIEELNANNYHTNDYMKISNSYIR